MSKIATIVVGQHDKTRAVLQLLEQGHLSGLEAIELLGIEISADQAIRLEDAVSYVMDVPILADIPDLEPKYAPAPKVFKPDVEYPAPSDGDPDSRAARRRAMKAKSTVQQLRKAVRK